MRENRAEYEKNFANWILRQNVDSALKRLAQPPINVVTFYRYARYGFYYFKAVMNANNINNRNSSWIYNTTTKKIGQIRSIFSMNHGRQRYNLLHIDYIKRYRENQHGFVFNLNENNRASINNVLHSLFTIIECLRPISITPIKNDQWIANIIQD